MASTILSVTHVQVLLINVRTRYIILLGNDDITVIKNLSWKKWLNKSWHTLTQKGWNEKVKGCVILYLKPTISLPESEDGDRDSSARGKTSVFGSSGKQVKSWNDNMWTKHRFVNPLLHQQRWLHLSLEPGWPMLWFSSWSASLLLCRPSSPRSQCRYDSYHDDPYDKDYYWLWWGVRLGLKFILHRNLKKNAQMCW